MTDEECPTIAPMRSGVVSNARPDKAIDAWLQAWVDNADARTILDYIAALQFS